MSISRRVPLHRGISLPENSEIMSAIIANNTVLSSEEINAQHSPTPNVFNFDGLSSLVDSSDTSNDIRNDYDRIFHTQQLPGETPTFLRLLSSNLRYYAGPSSRQYYVETPSCRRLQPPPLPYVTLREQQVLQLQKEIKHPGGIRVQIRRKDCISSIAFVDAFSSVW